MKTMKAVLISIHPKWCELIASGKKTIEVRKTAPKIQTPFKCYIYETQGKTESPWMDEEGHMIFRGRGMVIGEFICRRITSTAVWRLRGETGKCAKRTAGEEQFPGLSCLTIDEIREYAGSNQRIVYGWHISDLVIYDKPKPLSKYLRCPYPWDCGACDYFDGLDMVCEKPKRPPQSWCYVEEL